MKGKRGNGSIVTIWTIFKYLMAAIIVLLIINLSCRLRDATMQEKKIATKSLNFVYNEVRDMIEKLEKSDKISDEINFQIKMSSDYIFYVDIDNSFCLYKEDRSEKIDCPKNQLKNVIFDPPKTIIRGSDKPISVNLKVTKSESNFIVSILQ